ncbi:hypothetical protein K469DRAFT_745185 [Zopfia rhizophila CBS 207.26]|uniref:Rhodopsin domain-containing protein n=1 Tax=Zopfia rhizophila CBS 207.26 TaxID=1314779 RepID=A0A6A6ESI5_9PEZI|nr:hypothetical protein K469DRAFT_745185 [Zopfia rhizophila CBS 207.26]
MENRSGEVLAVAGLFFALTWLTVGLRVYVRAGMLKIFGKDDWTMVVTLVLFTVYLVFQIVAAVYGTGRHIWDLERRRARTALIFWYLCELFYVLSNCTLKISLGIFYLRVAMQRWHIMCIKILMLGTAFFGGCYFFMAMFQCIPISEFWNVHPATNKCIPKAPTTGITYALSAVNAFADWAFGTLPIFIVWDLQMNIRTKILVVSILAFAAIGSTATVVRMRYIHTLTNGPDFLWATTDVAIWSTVEPGIGITAGSMATLRPLLQTCLWRLGLVSSPASARVQESDRSGRSGQKGRSRIGYHRSLGLDDLRSTEASTSTTISGPQKPDKSWHGRNRSEAEDKERMMGAGINKSVQVEYSYEGPPRVDLRDSIIQEL